jgi:hypothetical protein
VSERVRRRHTALLSKFALCFASPDGMRADELNTSAWSLRRGLAGASGFALVATSSGPPFGRSTGEVGDAECRRDPRLFEAFLLGYRSAEGQLRGCRLLASPPGARELARSEDAVFADRALSETLVAAGFLQIDWAENGQYDPACFAPVEGRRDPQILQLDHEEILCRRRIKVVASIAASFRDLVEQTIAAATHVPKLRA